MAADGRHTPGIAWPQVEVTLGAAALTPCGVGRVHPWMIGVCGGRPWIVPVAPAGTATVAGIRALLRRFMGSAFLLNGVTPTRQAFHLVPPHPRFEPVHPHQWSPLESLQPPTSNVEFPPFSWSFSNVID
jgi:hypothetical protein